MEAPSGQTQVSHYSHGKRGASARHELSTKLIQLGAMFLLEMTGKGIKLRPVASWSGSAINS
jgi:hypothetical protein